ncbi:MULTISPECIES: GTPase ObgE [Planococcus]|uniref:GTPase Obg n=1 Tax=Planococcus kocurii TaxID=1374 RepID=A0ABN4JVP8_9BACL|nr:MULTISPECIES: GTPase ObgE [Planococcus]ALS78971.1 GTPase Obg [Planococcus kocurii]KAA0957839.1 GTPase ObgE [Planococcus sp. ANT_H30]MDJ0331011.1 GTPase ObgE [Planococcus sp. S3-L1]
MFVDHVKVYVRGGDGGDGMVAFRREKYVPNGGPAGGDGGKGGNIVFIVEEGLRTLMDFRYKRIFKAERGTHGMSKNQHGAKAEDTFIKVPPGTVVKDVDSGETIADLVEHGQTAVIAKGGRGGRGNSRFATPANPAPELSEKGEPGYERNVILELKVLADAGLVGFPSVGKSTLLSVVSAAKPKIAEYHFTTIVPNLGMVETEDQRSFVMADLPGLIEGAHQGVGLGHQFLRHIERTRVIIHVIDMSGLEGRDAYDDYVTINEELKQYNMRLTERPQLIVANKMDMPDSEENLAKFREKLPEDARIFPISALSRKGLNNLLFAIADVIEVTPEFPLIDEEEADSESTVLYKHETDADGFDITRGPDGAFILTGYAIERMFKMTDFSREDSIRRFSRQMRGMGIDDALRERGAENGDTVRLLEFEFEFMD